MEKLRLKFALLSERQKASLDFCTSDFIKGRNLNKKDKILRKIYIRLLNRPELL
jgi:hypothetical protein